MEPLTQEQATQKLKDLHAAISKLITEANILGATFTLTESCEDNGQVNAISASSIGGSISAVLLALSRFIVNDLHPDATQMLMDAILLGLEQKQKAHAATAPSKQVSADDLLKMPMPKKNWMH